MCSRTTKNSASMWFVTQMLHQFCGRTSRTPKIWMGCSPAGTRNRRSTTQKAGCIGALPEKMSASSKGVQIIRTAAILQLLLGNIGRPGGGILALRGHASIQGSTDVSTLYDIFPGYLPMPFFGADSHTLQEYIKKHRVRIGLWSNFDAYIISLLKAYYGDGATKDNDFGFNWLPRVTGDHSHYGYWLDMQDGKMEGLFVMGQNPAVGASNGRLESKDLAKLKWLGVREMVETETTSFWLDLPTGERGEISPDTI